MTRQLGMQPGWYDDQTARKLTKPFSLDLYNGSNFSWIANAIIGAFVSTFWWQPTKWADIADGAPGGSAGSARQWRQRTTCPSVQDQNKNSNKNGARIFSKFAFQSIALRLVQIRWRKKQRKVRFGTVCLSSRIPRDWRANIDKVGRQNGCKIEVGFQSLLAIYRWKQALVGFAFKIIKSETTDKVEVQDWDKKIVDWLFVQGFGTCCFFSTTSCGGTITNNLTYIRNPGYAGKMAVTSDTTCEYKFTKINSNVCQVDSEL